MSDFEKFLFDTSFEPGRVRDAEARAQAEAEAEAEPPAPTFSEEELAAARQSAFAEGKAAGLAESGQAQARRLADILDCLPRHLESLATELESLEAERHRSALEAAVTVVRKLFPRLAQEGGLDEIRAVVDSCLERLRDEPRLVIRSADQDLDALRDRIEGSATRAGFEGKLVFLADENIAPGDVRVEWADGGAERDQADLWRDIDTIVDRALTPTQGAAAVTELQNQNPAAPQGAENQSQPQEPVEIEPPRRAQRA